MKRVIFRTIEAAASQSGAMEADTILQHGACPKSYKSRGDFFRKACFALLAVCIIFSGCDKKDDEKDDGNPENGTFTITAKVENGNAYNNLFKTVEAEISYAYWAGYSIIASGDYDNGGFTLILPATVDRKYLLNMKELWDGTNGIDDYFGGKNIIISNPEVKVSQVNYFNGYDSHGKWAGGFSYVKGSYPFEYEEVKFWYVDTDVTITGSVTTYNGIEEWDVSLKKGWNMVYFSNKNRNENTEYTTKKIDGLKWYLNDDWWNE